MTPRPLSSVYVAGVDDAAWSCGESPAEVATLIDEVEQAGATWVELTIAGVDDDDLDDDTPRWDGRTVMVRAAQVVAIGPPLARSGG